MKIYSNVQSTDTKHNLDIQKFISVDKGDNQSQLNMTADEVEQKINLMNANSLNGPLEKGENEMS